MKDRDADRARRRRPRQALDGLEYREVQRRKALVLIVVVLGTLTLVALAAVLALVFWTA